MKAPVFWYKPRSLLGDFLAPLEIFYGAGSAVRRKWAKPYRAKIPVICVGNIVAGGSGKTPVALAIAALLKQAGHKPVFVTRGYGGQMRGPLQVDLTQHKATDVGDEALLLARAAPTWVGRNRPKAIRAAEKSGSHIILDDGLQNPHVLPDIGLLVIDGAMGLGNGRVIPAGPLRETLDDALKRVKAVVMVGEDQHSLAMRLNPLALHAKMEPVFPADFPRGEKFFAFAGIGRPKKFFDTCRRAGLSIVAAQAFADHHVFTAAELAVLKQDAAKQKARLLTTEKDWVRLPEVFRRDVLVLPATIHFEKPEEIGKLVQSSITALRLPS